MNIHLPNELAQALNANWRRALLAGMKGPAYADLNSYVIHCLERVTYPVGDGGEVADATEHSQESTY